MKKFKVILKHFFVPHRSNAFRPHALRHNALSLYLLIIVAVQLGVGVTLNAGPEVKGAESEDLAYNIVVLTNQERNKAGAAPLFENSTLDMAAQKKLEDMFAKNYWDHTGPNGETAWDFISGQNYQYEVAGENLAKGFKSSKEVVSAWMGSPTHKKNLLNDRFQEIGIAVGSGKIKGVTTTVIVQIFGRPKTAFASESIKGELSTAQTVIPEMDLSNVTVPSKAPYFLVWSMLFGLLLVDGILLRKLGLHMSPRHLYGYRTALAMSLFVLVLLSLGFSAIA